MDHHLDALVGDGEEVTIIEQADYPFREEVSFVAKCASPVAFPLFCAAASPPLPPVPPVPETQVAPEQAWPSVHWVSQLPQWVGSVFTLVHTPPQSVLGARQQTPPMQAAPPQSMSVSTAFSTPSRQVGTWQTLRRNILDDFVRAFGEQPGRLTAVGVLTDTDNTGEQAVAWYGPIRLISK